VVGDILRKEESEMGWVDRKRKETQRVCGKGKI
jgi:hypothetical protein